MSSTPPVDVPTADPPATAANHPTYSEMITTAILALNENGGSSKQAISKYIDSNFLSLPPTHSSFLMQHLKQMRNNGLLVMNKHSYMLPGFQPTGNVVNSQSPDRLNIGLELPRTSPFQPNGFGASQNINVPGHVAQHPGVVQNYGEVRGPFFPAPSYGQDSGPSGPIQSFVGPYGPVPTFAPSVQAFNQFGRPAAPFFAGLSPKVQYMGQFGGSSTPAQTVGHFVGSHASVPNVGPFYPPFAVLPTSNQDIHSGFDPVVAAPTVVPIGQVDEPIGQRDEPVAQGDVALAKRSRGRPRKDKSVVFRAEPVGPLVVAGQIDEPIAQGDVPPAKRGRGRPRKDKSVVITAEPVESVGPLAVADRPVDGSATVAKRRPGRPRRVDNGLANSKSSSGLIGSGSTEPLGMKRPRGRPRKSPATASTAGATGNAGGRTKENVAVEEGELVPYDGAAAGGSGGVLPVKRAGRPPKGGGAKKARKLSGKPLGRPKKDPAIQASKQQQLEMAYQVLKSNFELLQSKAKQTAGVVMPYLDENAVIPLGALQELLELASMDICAPVQSALVQSALVQSAPIADQSGPSTVQGQEEPFVQN